MTQHTISTLITTGVFAALLLAGCLDDGFGQLRDDCKSVSHQITHIRTELAKAGR